MKNKLLFFDMEFTSLSPDSQLISLGIVSDCGKTSYFEFSDFDINRCDQWVKDNVVSKLILNKNELPNGKENACSFDLIDRGKYVLYQKERTEFDHNTLVQYDNSPMVFGNTTGIKQTLKQWLSQFSDYNIQFVADCGTYDWFFLVQLLAEWDEVMIGFHDLGTPVLPTFKIGLPKLPANISPVPFDLNDLIAIKKGITPMEAFDLNREVLAGNWVNFAEWNFQQTGYVDVMGYKHNALFDSKIIKEIYNKLK